MFWVAGAGSFANFRDWRDRVGAAVQDRVAGAAFASEGMRRWRVRGVQVNLMLDGNSNLLPILPLDGGRIAVSLLPALAGDALREARNRTAFMVVILLLATGIPELLMAPLMAVGYLALKSHRRPVTAGTTTSPHMFADRVLSGMRPRAACTSATTTARSRLAAAAGRIRVACTSRPTGTR